MSSLKVFQLATDGKVVQVDLAAKKGIKPHDIHPHSLSSKLPTDDNLASIMTKAAAQGHRDLGVVQVGIGDPLSVPSDTAIPQETHIVNLKQVALKGI